MMTAGDYGDGDQLANSFHGSYSGRNQEFEAGSFR